MYTMITIPRLTHVLLGIDINRLVPVPAIYQYLSSKDVRYFFFFFFFSRSKQGGENQDDVGLSLASCIHTCARKEDRWQYDFGRYKDLTRCVYMVTDATFYI